MKNKIVIALAALLLIPFFALGAETDSAASKASPSFYSFTVNWNSDDNSLVLNGSVAISKQNVLKDSGSGSQFYARVIDFANKPKPFKDGDSKIYLGKWQAGSDPKKTEKKITIPYASDGQRVVIFDAKDKKAKLTVNVTKFARLEKPVQGAAAAAKSPADQAAAPQTYLVGGHSAAYWWTMRILILAVLVGLGYFIWWWRRKKKAAQTNNVVNLTKTKKY